MREYEKKEWVIEIGDGMCVIIKNAFLNFFPIKFKLLYKIWYVYFRAFKKGKEKKRIEYMLGHIEKWKMYKRKRMKQTNISKLTELRASIVNLNSNVDIGRKYIYMQRVANG